MDNEGYACLATLLETSMFRDVTTLDIFAAIYKDKSGDGRLKSEIWNRIPAITPFFKVIELSHNNIDKILNSPPL